MCSIGYCVFITRFLHYKPHKGNNKAKTGLYSLKKECLASKEVVSSRVPYMVYFIESQLFILTDDLH